MTVRNWVATIHRTVKSSKEKIKKNNEDFIKLAEMTDILQFEEEIGRLEARISYLEDENEALRWRSF